LLQAASWRPFRHRLRAVLVGGGPAPQRLLDACASLGVPALPTYGLTEAASQVTTLAPGERAGLPGALGRPLWPTEVRITGDPGAGGTGEILVRGPTVTPGYLDRPVETAAALADGWLHTGDLGVLDAEGWLTLRGRSKTILLGPSGQNIYPEEVEARLNALPYVGESLVLEKEGRLVALVYPDLERVDEKHVGEADLLRILEESRVALNASLPSWAAVSRIDLWPEEFEKTPTRKIKRFVYGLPS
jgi:long-chain acyl-CoA synthetase